MFSCANCFRDNELVSYSNTQSTQFGDCNFCGAINVKIIDTRELSGYFTRFIEAYIPSENEEGSNLLTLIDHDWILFPEDCTYKLTLLEEIFKGIDDYEAILSKNYFTPSSDEGNSAIENWNRFSDEVKTKNRYFLSNKVDLELLEKIISNTCSFMHRERKIFYRARICSNGRGLPINEMGKPPSEKATPGRANPKGIAYLYLSNDEKTTLFETRSYVYDFVTIAEFQLLQDIKVAKLQNIDKLSPFLLEEDIIKRFLALKPYLLTLEKELSKPIRRGDNELDYLPSQYLCEFIKSIGFDGIEYRSSLNQSGFNIALFRDDKVRCIRVKTVQVKIRDIEQEQVDVTEL